MLNDILDFNERKSWCAITDHDAMRKCLDLLHKNDKAVLRYFGTDRQGLLKQLHCSSQVVNKGNAPVVEELDRKVGIIASLRHECEGQDAFSSFYARWHVYFKHVFYSDEKYNLFRKWIDVETFLSSVRPYVISLIKSFSEKSLVHQLNSRIANGNELDLETFDRALADEALVPFLTSYPVLTRLLLDQVDDIVMYLYKVIGHFVEDINRLDTAFGLSGRQIDSIILGLGDSHANGETVCCLRIGNQSLMYKPRNNREALFYGALLDQLHEHTGNTCFSVYSPIMVSLDNHCWIEKIENLACDSESDLALFFQRLGAQVAVIHALNGIDFHYENIIARGSSPVMIDLECLFTSAMIDLRVKVPHGRALFKAIKFNSQSVYSSGFVPYSPDSDNDYSGLSRQQQFVSKKRQLVREHRFYRLKQVAVDNQPTLRHLPVFEGEARSVTEYSGAFFLGFEQGYDEVMNRSGAVLALLEQHAAGLKTRVLIKNTQRYADFIGMMLHPTFTQCKVRHEMLLATLWSDLNETLNDYGIPGHEIEDLAKANIPCFTQPLLSDCLLDAHGQTVASLAIERPFDSCRRKLDSLSPADKAFQMHVLQMCLFPVASEALPLNREHQLKAVPDLSPAQCLEGAMKIAGVIEKMRMEGDEGDVGWTFMDTHPRTGRHFISPMGSGLYNGMGGLAIFYLSLFRVSGTTRYLDEAERILCSMSKSHGHFPNELSVSAYFGLASWLYVLVNYQLMTGRQTYQPTVDELLLKLADFPHEGDEFDFIHGWCGAVTVLVNLYQLEKREALRLLIEKFSQAIQSALTLDDGTLVLNATGKPLWTGFSHGISGVLQAIGKVWEVTKDPLLAKLITQWLQAENRLTADGFWLDLRETAKSSSTIKWCHGDGGILISRRWLTRTMGEALGVETRAVLEQDAERCERHLWEHGLGSGYSLCHGDFGNLMCLLKLYRETGDEQGQANVRRALSQVAHNFFNEDFLDERNVPDLGMMLGITGVGQALLHAVEAGLPDVLSLDFARPVVA
ncbi:type 2 lantibiotic biosynthesis protein LanM [Pseudomonas migulae]|uniref:type 2 lanthipeptide synthetase LanM n=1 Tax=Pseudomonas migulae TaxID=78543 RepID=UPI00209F82E5|nr:type 2 lanthipeptide synthetase LanM [Pseudomonas migulae]MCP1498046.1 type 2 lantibiotic biosynthesis protein LanM [Pseudomonas migulae]